MNHLISVWLTDDVLDQAVSRLKAITKQQTEPVAKYHERFTTLARDLPEIFGPAEILSMLINGSTPILRAYAKLAR